MVRDNRVREYTLPMVANSAGQFNAFSSGPINGFLHAVEVHMSTARTGDISVFPSGHFGQAAFKMAFIQASGDTFIAPSILMKLNTTGADALVTTQIPINDYIGISGTNMGNGSALDIHLFVV